MKQCETWEKLVKNGGSVRCGFFKTKDDSRVAWSIREPPGLLTRLGDSRLKPRPQTKCLESLGVLVVKKKKKMSQDFVDCD